MGQSGTMYYGYSCHILDSKNRLVIPKRFVKELSNKVYILRGYEGCLSLYDEKSFNSYIEKLSSYSFEDKNYRSLIRTALSSVTEINIDNKNRIQIPIDLINKYNISSSIAVVGVFDHLEIWNKEKWDEYSKTSNEEFENISQKLLGGKDHE